MTFLGFLFFFDPPKPGIVNTLENVEKLGISLKVITGDNKFVAASISREVGFKNSRVLTGSELDKMSSEAMIRQVKNTDVFAEIEPNQKEHIILALKKSGNVVGYMGDGINDASALHGYQFQFREYVQHGWSIPFPAISLSAAHADPANQFIY